MSCGIYWLASYPKSGNTWFRIFLANLLNPLAAPININHIRVGHHASDRAWINQMLGFDSTLLSADELDQLRPSLYAWSAQNNNSVTYQKTHDAYTYLSTGFPIIPKAGCLGALYFIRNPLDVAISFADHMACSIDNAIEMLRNKEAYIPFRLKQHMQVRQKLLSWTLHVKSWVSVTDIDIFPVRYEDMYHETLKTFKRMCSFLKLNASEHELQQAIQHASFNALQQQELSLGFHEKAPRQGRFFRKGIANDWKNVLTKTQINQIIRDHDEVMFTYHYVDSSGNPL